MTTYTATADFVSQPSTIMGEADRVFFTSSALKATGSVVEIESHKSSSGSGELTSTDHIIEGRARIVNVELQLRCSPSIVEASVYSNVSSQDAMHTQRVFVIRKDPVRTIIVRQTPTRNSY